jgi:hypothetical protein
MEQDQIEDWKFSLKDSFSISPKDRVEVDRWLSQCEKIVKERMVDVFYESMGA